MCSTEIEKLADISEGETDAAVAVRTSANPVPSASTSSSAPPTVVGATNTVDAGGPSSQIVDLDASGELNFTEPLFTHEHMTQTFIPIIRFLPSLTVRNGPKNGMLLFEVDGLAYSQICKQSHHLVPIH